MPELIVHRIDVHHHFVPPAYRDAMSRQNEGRRRGIAGIACASVARRDERERHSGGAAVDLGAGCVFRRPRSSARSHVNVTNLRRSFAMRIPALRFVRGSADAVYRACAEAVHALDVLKADGVVLLGSTEGKFLGAPEFDELMAETDRRQAVVFVRTCIGRASRSRCARLPDRVSVRYDARGGQPDADGDAGRYPNIRWILARAGGFLPYVAWRVSLANLMPEYLSAVPAGALTYIRRFHFDTALSPAAYPQAALRELVEPSGSCSAAISRSRRRR